MTFALVLVCAIAIGAPVPISMGLSEEASMDFAREPLKRRARKTAIWMGFVAAEVFACGVSYKLLISP